MAAISAGEFERIFKEFYKPLCLFALRFTEKTEDAEDVVQQVFADVWDKNSHDMVIANFKSYLYQAVRNRSLTLIAQSSDMLQTTECIADIEDLSEEEQIYQSDMSADNFILSVENQMGKALKTLRETAIRIYCFFFS